MTMVGPGAGGSQPLEIKIEKLDQALHTAPVIYVDGAHAFAGNDQAVRFNFFQDKLLSGEISLQGVPVERVVCARIVMAPAVFKQLVLWLNQNASMMFPPETK